MLLFITAVSVVLVVSFMCSIFESVLLSLTRPQVEVMVHRGQKAGELLARFKENMDVPIAAILILNTAAHTIGAAVAGASYTNVFGAGTLWVFSIVFTIAVLLMTEIIPKTLGVSYARALAAPVAYGIRWLTVVLKPMVVVSESISRSIRRGTPMPVTSAEEIRLLAALGASEGVVGTKTAGIIVGATHLRHLDAEDAMLPRERIRFLSGTMSRDEAVRYARESGHSRFPYSPTSNVDDITGVVLVKELLYWLLENGGDEIDWEALRHDALIVPPGVSLPQLLRNYQESHRHLAIVVDEYGSVEGLIAMEDVLEEIVGDIRDETDLPAKDYYAASDGTLVARADVDLRIVCAKLDIPWQPDVEASTIGGLINETLERIPVAGDTIDWNGYRFEVLRADRRRARVVSIREI